MRKDILTKARLEAAVGFVLAAMLVLAAMSGFGDRRFAGFLTALFYAAGTLLLVLAALFGRLFGKSRGRKGRGKPDRGAEA